MKPVKIKLLKTLSFINPQSTSIEQIVGEIVNWVQSLFVVLAQQHTLQVCPLANQWVNVFIGTFGGKNIRYSISLASLAWLL